MLLSHIRIILNELIFNEGIIMVLARVLHYTTGLMLLEITRKILRVHINAKTYRLT